MTGRLRPIVELARQRAAKLEPTRPTLEAAARGAAPAPGWIEALSTSRVEIIAEIKRRSPSGGTIAAIPDAAERARAYEVGGAAAVSVLTEQEYFGGSLEDLRAVHRRVDLPVLRKDFIVSPVQIVESRAAGASAVLLIARILEKEQLTELLASATNWGLGTLVEVHDRHELDVALACGAPVVGMNARDLDTFRVNLEGLNELLPQVPRDTIAVAESGVGGRRDVERLAAWGADAVLVGTYLARHAEPDRAVQSLTDTPRKARATEVQR